MTYARTWGVSIINVIQHSSSRPEIKYFGSVQKQVSHLWFLYRMTDHYFRTFLFRLQDSITFWRNFKLFASRSIMSLNWHKMKIKKKWFQQTLFDYIFSKIIKIFSNERKYSFAVSVGGKSVFQYLLVTLWKWRFQVCCVT